MEKFVRAYCDEIIDRLADRYLFNGPVIVTVNGKRRDARNIMTLAKIAQDIVPVILAAAK